MPNLNWISQKYFPHLTPRLINCGDCYNWAYIAYISYNRVKLFTIDEYGGHAFIKINNKYFDSESPQGIIDWTQLKILRLMGDIRQMYPRQQALDEFLRYWRVEGKNPLINLGL